VTSFYTIDRANERLAELTPVLEALRLRRREVIALRDGLALARREQGAVTGSRPGSESREEGQEPLADAEASREAGLPANAGLPRTAGSSREAGSPVETPRVFALRIQGTIDRMQGDVARIDEWSIQLRDIDTGLVDFPALVNGRPVWLCWRLGEPEVSWWHELSAGVAGRRPIGELT